MKTGIKIRNTITMTAVALLLSCGVWADNTGQVMDAASAQDGPTMNQHMMDPVMMQNMMQMRQQRMAECRARHQQGGPMMDRNCMMMDPVMRENMMKMRQQRMSQGQGGMPMMGENNPRMMDPVMRENMMQMRQQRMEKARQGVMMSPEMMQKMMQMRQQHMQRMQNMEQRLSNIEATLKELLEQDKDESGS
jgi:hypothetical protein